MDPMPRLVHLKGKAWQAELKPNGNQFYSQKEQEVAIFIDIDGAAPESCGMSPDATLEIAETIAHESGHGYGLQHINPDDGPSEVMDYQATPTGLVPAFWDQPVNIKDPPLVTSGTSCNFAKNVTHNPEYHLKKYVTGQRSTGSPGSWDGGPQVVFRSSITSLAFQSPIYNAAIFRSGSDAFGIGGEGSTLISKIESLQPGQQTGIEWFYGQSSSIQILASTAPGDSWNLMFAVGEPGNTIFEPTPGITDGLIVQFSSESQTFIPVGSFSAEVDVIATITPDDAISVSEPALDFGVVDVGDFLELTFDVRNVAEEEITGTLVTEAPFSLPTGASFQLLPGESDSITVRFDPTVAGSVAGHVKIQSTGGQAVVSLAGIGKAMLLPRVVNELVLPVALNFNLSFSPLVQFSFDMGMMNISRQLYPDRLTQRLPQSHPVRLWNPWRMPTMARPTWEHNFSMGVC